MLYRFSSGLMPVSRRSASFAKKASSSLSGGYRLYSSSSISSHSIGLANEKPEKLPFIPLLVSLEGNIGAGKTTLLRKLRKTHPDWIAIDEPVETWCQIQNEQGESILELFYKNKRRWAYTFQSCVLLTRYHNIETAIKNAREEKKHSGGVHVFLTERCMDSDYHVFAKMLREEGSLDSMELQIYERLLGQLRSTATPLSAIIHINNPPTVCQERIKIRGRSGESSITTTYLQSLESHQSKWMQSTNIPTLTTNAENVEDVDTFITLEVQKIVSDTCSKFQM